MLTVGSLFAGIGGFDLGFERAGMRTLWQVEQNEFCRGVLAQHFPDAHQFVDVRYVTGDPKRWADEGGCLLEYVDVLCGGFPCQDISNAGRRAGIEGERSGLWSEYARLISELRPRYVVVENVSALLARGLGTVLGDLAALGYDAEWDCIPASAVGAPHRRDRIWIVAYPRSNDGGSRRSGRPAPSGSREPESVRALQVADPNGKGLQGHGRPVQRSREIPAASGGGTDRAGEVGDPVRSGLQRGGLREGRPREVGRGRPADTSSADGDAWAVEPDVGRVAYGVPARVDRIRSLGNALVPQVAEFIGRRIIEWEEGGIAA